MLRDWWRSLERIPAPLSGRQRPAVIMATAVVAFTRLVALARTPWDWDELLFMQGLDRFDVARHHPHPPGYPLYILAGKLIRDASGLSDFHSLQLISVLGGAAIVPAMFLLCRELRVRFSTAMAASLLLAFFPNVWFYGGAAFSDVPATALIVVSIALLFAGCRTPRAYAAGALLLGIAAGFRPQALLIGLAPFLIATTFQIRRSVARVAVAATAIIGITAVSYGAAAWLTGWGAYKLALADHSAYIMSVDSFRSSLRPPLWRVFDDFFVMPYHAPAINAIVAAMALASAVVALVRRRPAVLAAIAAFGPFCIFAWLMLDRFSASRFSVAYAPLMALLVADGMSLITRRAALELAATVALVLTMITWSWPALRDNRSVAPPVAAVLWIRGHADSRQSVIYVDPRMRPFAEWYLHEYRLESPDETGSYDSLQPPGYFLSEGISRIPDAMNFVRRHGRLWDLVRRRYFDVSVRSFAAIEFGEGWYGEEGSGALAWRWMAGRSDAHLPPIEGMARLTISLYAPLDALARSPEVTIRLNGNVVDHFRPSSDRIDRETVVLARADAANDLQIETDRTVMPAGQHRGSDQRLLGLRLDSIRWMPAR